MKPIVLVGQPVAGSLSPRMHNAALAACGLPEVYQAQEMDEAGLPGLFEALRRGELAGANVTIPHKRRAFALCDRTDEAARRARAVNTLVPRPAWLSRRTRVHGANTDATALAAVLGELGLDPLVCRRACVLGAGGAAAAVVLALYDAGLGEVRTVTRNPSHADALFHPVLPWSEAALRHVLGDAGVLINASAAGMDGAEPPCPVPIDALPGRAVVVDLVYRPLETPLLGAARARGLRTIDGITLLVRQGAASFELWTGKKAPIDVMERAAREEAG